MMSLFKSRMTSSTATTTTTTTTMEQERSIAETLASLGASSQQTVTDSDSTEEQRKKEGKFPFPSEQQLTKPESSPSDSNDKKPFSKNTTIDSTDSTPTPLISTNVWRDDDILAGRSREVRCHVGNARFRDLIDEYQPAYKKAGRKLEKSRIAVKVFKIVQSRGGRFLDCKPDDPNSWFEISYDKAVAKVSQTLRKGAKHMKTTTTTAANQPSKKNHTSNQGDDSEGGSKSSDERKRASSRNPNEDLPKTKKSKLDHGSISSRRDSLSSEGASSSATRDQSSSTPQEEKPLNKKKNNTSSLKKKEGPTSGSAATGESTTAHGLANALRAAGATDSSLQHLLPGWASNGIAAKNSSAIPSFLQNPPHSSFAVSNAQYSMPTVQHPLAGGNHNMDLQALLSTTHHQQHQHAATLPLSLSLQEIQALAHIQQSLNLGHQLSSSGTLPATTLQTLTGASSSIGGISLPIIQELQQLQGHQHHSSGKPILLAVPQSQITGITNAGGSDSQQPLALVVGTLGTCCQCGAKAVPQRLPTNYHDDPNKQGAKDSHQPSSSTAESPFSAPSNLPPQNHS